MNRRKAFGTIGAVAVGAAVTAPFAMAAGPQINMWVDRWKKAKTFTIAVADAMPADSFSYKPAGIDEIRTFAGQMVHIGQAEGFYIGRLGKNGAAPMAPQGEGKAEVLAYMNAFFDWSIGAINELTDADLTKTFGDGKMASSGLDLLLNAFVHTSHTRGYAEMYLRSKGVKPPNYAA